MKRPMLQQEKIPKSPHIIRALDGWHSVVLEDSQDAVISKYIVVLLHVTTAEQMRISLTKQSSPLVGPPLQPVTPIYVKMIEIRVTIAGSSNDCTNKLMLYYTYQYIFIIS